MEMRTTSPVEVRLEIAGFWKAVAARPGRKSPPVEQANNGKQEEQKDYARNESQPSRRERAKQDAGGGRAGRPRRTTATAEAIRGCVEYSAELESRFPPLQPCAGHRGMLQRSWIFLDCPR